MSDSETNFPPDKQPDVHRMIRIIRELEAQGMTEQQAANLAVRIGDKPEKDGEGNVVVRDEHGNELARVKLKEFRN